MGGVDGIEWGWGYVGEGYEVICIVDYIYYIFVYEFN